MLCLAYSGIFFLTCYFQCSLERHPLAVSTSQWKGGPLRIDPLATVQVCKPEIRMKYLYCTWYFNLSIGVWFIDAGAVHDDSWIWSKWVWLATAGGLWCWWQWSRWNYGRCPLPAQCKSLKLFLSLSLSLSLSHTHTHTRAHTRIYSYTVYLDKDLTSNKAWWTPLWYLLLTFFLLLLNFRHFVEFLINDRVLPYNMTIFQAIRQFATVRVSTDHQGLKLSW